MKNIRLLKKKKTGNLQKIYTTKELQKKIKRNDKKY